MNHHIILREYQKSDRKLLEDVVRETWNYDRFCTPKTAAKLASVYLSSCLANQTFTQVALMNDTPVGIIMVKNRKKHKCLFGFAIKRAASIISLLCSKEGRTVSRIFECVETIDQELLCQCKTDYQGELAFLRSVKPAGARAWEKHCLRKRWNICVKNTFATFIYSPIQAAITASTSIREWSVSKKRNTAFI